MKTGRKKGSEASVRHRKEDQEDRISRSIDVNKQVIMDTFGESADLGYEKGDFQ